METQTTKHGARDAEMPAVAGERVLRLLGMTQRPLEWSELQRALGLQSHEFRPAWEWLLDNEYVSPTALATAGAVPRSIEELWALADKGHEWAKRHGALRTQDVN
jgi:hypothetical protein